MTQPSSAVIELRDLQLQTEIGTYGPKEEEDYMREILDLLDLKRLTSLAESILKRVISGDFLPVTFK